MQLGRALAVAAAAMIGIGVNATPSHAVNLLLNGDFSAGNTGFSSDYTFAGAGAINAPGQYKVVSAADINLASTNSYGDWTATNTEPGGGSGKVLVADGATVANQRVWYESVTLDPHTDYKFKLSAIDLNALGTANAILQINSSTTAIPLSHLLSFGTNNGGWSTTEFVINSDLLSNNSASPFLATFAIVDAKGTSTKNDFAIDKIQLTATPIPPAAVLFMSAIGGLGFVGWRRRATATLTA